MEDKVQLYSPRLVGNRFRAHTLPLELIEDLSTLEVLTREMAKHLFYKENPDRQRIPKGFNEAVSFDLEGVSEGSAIANIVLVFTLTDLFTPSETKYFEEARDQVVQAIAAAEKGEDATRFVPAHLLTHFNQFGKNLREDEFIEFTPNSDTKTIYNNDSRRRLIDASTRQNEYIRQVELRATVSEMNKGRKSFQIELIEGKNLAAFYEESQKNVIEPAFMNYESNKKVLIKGMGKFVDSILKSLTSVESITLLEELDVPSRLDELLSLNAGWLNGEGSALNRENVNWFSVMFETNFSSQLLLPHIFPIPDGNIQAEWSKNEWEVSLTVDLTAKKGFYQAVNMNTDQVIEDDLNLAEKESWDLLNSRLSNLPLQKV